MQQAQLVIRLGMDIREVLFREAEPDGKSTKNMLLYFKTILYMS